MALSSQYNRLKREIYQLRRDYLPRKFDPTGTYKARVHQLARSFRVHVHAEIEVYLEACANDLITTGVNVITSSRPNSPAIGVLNTRLVSIKKNHGIKASNFGNLFDCFGIDKTTLPSTLLPGLESYGLTRGNIAHSSRATYTAAHPADPRNELQTALTLLADLKVFDKVILICCRNY